MGAVTSSDGLCIECERKDHWIEIQLIDEYNRPFHPVNGKLTPPSSTRPISFTIVDGPILFSGLAAGIVTICLDKDPWLKEAQQHRIYQDNGKNRDGDQGQTLADAPNPKGYQGVKRKLINVTAADLTQVKSEQLPARHAAGSLDKLKLVTGHSYIIKVQGFNYITLRLGMFFDGTANHTFSAEWGHKKLNGYYHKWKSLAQTALEQCSNKEGKKLTSLQQLSSKDLTEYCSTCLTYPDEVEGSAANDVTNVQKMYDLYTDNKFSDDQREFIHREYITGVGTDNIHTIHKAEEEISGEAFGRGEYGVIAKAETGISQILTSLSVLMRDYFKQTTLFDGLQQIIFDVYGFSRGAAAARHFINLVLDTSGQDGSFASRFESACRAKQIALKYGFDWSDNADCHIAFAGLFDTVAATAWASEITELGEAIHNDDNGDVKLWLDPKRVKQAVHLRANDQIEVRYNFSSNKLNPAENFHEYTLLGAHSDIGGGYISRYSYASTMHDYDLVCAEKLLVAQWQETVHWNDKQRPRELIQEKANDVINRGIWPKDRFYLEITKHTQRRGRGDNYNYLVGKLYISHIVEGELSKLYLGMMFGLSQFYGVPVREFFGKMDTPVWEIKANKEFFIPEQVRNFNFKKLFNQVLNSAKKGQCYTNVSTTELLAAHLIHHSSHMGHMGAYKPYVIDGNYQRSVYECPKN